MAIFANGPDYQSYSVGTAPTQIFYTRGVGGTAIAGTVTVRNPTIANSGTVALYVGGGTIAAASGTATAAFLLGSGLVLQPGQQLVILGSAVTTSTALGNTFDMFGCTSANVTVVVESGYATQTLVS